VQNPGDPIILPRRLRSDSVDYECELAVVIGKICYNVAKSDALGYVLGYTCANDVSARDWQKEFGGSQWCRGKTFDTFCPLGPVMETEFDVTKGRIETLLNGVRKQYAPLTDMLFPIDVIIPWISRVMTLLPGDVIATGTPAGVGPMKAGDVVEIVIPEIGTLRNTTVNRPA
jgi:2-keto-4-pentenoate hydratase/2-oxohepta-3-ene-1,7-dioic acid hydratase in catechol pathway